MFIYSSHIPKVLKRLRMNWSGKMITVKQKMVISVILVVNDLFKWITLVHQVRVFWVVTTLYYTLTRVYIFSCLHFSFHHHGRKPEMKTLYLLIFFLTQVSLYKDTHLLTSNAFTSSYRLQNGSSQCWTRQRCSSHLERAARRRLRPQRGSGRLWAATGGIPVQSLPR